MNLEKLLVTNGLVVKWFSKKPGINCNVTYSPIIDAITFRYFLSLSVVENELDMRLMDGVTTYLYGKLDTEIYMKLPEGFCFRKYISPMLKGRTLPNWINCMD